MIREDKREVLTGETMGQVLSCEIKIQGVVLLNETEDYAVPDINKRV